MCEKYCLDYLNVFACGKIKGDVTGSFFGERLSAEPCIVLSALSVRLVLWSGLSESEVVHHVTLSIVICPMDAPPFLPSSLQTDLDLPGPISLFTSTTCISALVVEGAFNGVELWTAVLSISARSGRYGG